MTAPRDTYNPRPPRQRPALAGARSPTRPPTCGTHLRPGLALLDVGCGPGTLTVDLARHVVPGPAVGIDHVDDVLDEARRHAAEAGVTTVELRVGDAHDLDVADGSLDVVHAHQVLQHVSGPVAVLASCGGRARRRSSPPATPTTPGSRGTPRTRDWTGGWSATWPWPGATRRSPDAGRRLLGWALDAGFAEITPSASVWCHATDEDRAWWSDLWADRIRSSRFAAQALERGLTGADELGGPRCRVAALGCQRPRLARSWTARWSAGAEHRSAGGVPRSAASPDACLP